MMTIRNLTKRHAVAAYFVLAYVIAWGGIGLVVGTHGVRQGEGLSFAQMLEIWVAMLLGSGGVGLLLTAVLEGRAGLRTLLAGMTCWRVGLGWYAPLLVTPLVASVVLAVLSQLSPDFVPGIMRTSDTIVPVMMFLIVGFGTFVEELGWTGFVARRLRGQYSPLTIGLMVGVLWGSWHFMGEFTGHMSYGALFPLHFLAFWLIPLTAFRVLIVWVYDRTGSLLLAQLLHASYSPVLYVLGPAALSVTEQITYEMAFTVVLCVVIGVIVAAQSRRSAPRALQV